MKSALDGVRHGMRHRVRHRVRPRDLLTIKDGAREREIEYSCLEDIRAYEILVLKEVKELKEVEKFKEVKELREVKELKYVKELKEVKEIKEVKELKEVNELKGVKVNEDLKSKLNIPARLDVKSKGVVTHVYVTYGIKCSLCLKHGHKRANCPRKTDKLVLPVDAPAARTQRWTKPPSTSNTMLAAAPTPAASAAPPAAPTPAAVDPAPPPSRASNALGISALKIWSRKHQGKKGRARCRGLPHPSPCPPTTPPSQHQLRNCLHPSSRPPNTLQPCRAFIRGELPCPFRRDSIPRASCPCAEHQPNAITTRAFLDQY
ncbi:hypothetical protein LAZ67_X002781 [Cordylochernes scorpioides]|uniref:Uncharacterized protein n=1 Tax=Cordylochernes scorpioides TaxID=51811 RepID=A0ABY6LTW4_9ARAC|nr:hypothetical protein LAZ67_X002781 [Cordylochernes scorpioides]